MFFLKGRVARGKCRVHYVGSLLWCVRGSLLRRFLASGDLPPDCAEKAFWQRSPPHAQMFRECFRKGDALEDGTLERVVKLYIMVTLTYICTGMYVYVQIC